MCACLPILGSHSRDDTGCGCQMLFSQTYSFRRDWMFGNKSNASLLNPPSSHKADMLYIQYIPRNMHTVFALLCFVVVIHWLIVPFPSGLLHWQCGNLTIAPVPAKQPWWIWINTSCEFIMNDFMTTTKQSTTKPCAYFLGYTVLLGVVTGIAIHTVKLRYKWHLNGH